MYMYIEINPMKARATIKRKLGNVLQSQ